MTRTIAAFNAFADDESGATSIEYALIAGIISIAIVASLTSVSGELQSTFSKVEAELSTNLAAN